MVTEEALELAREELKIAQGSLVAAIIASCTCLTKTSELAFHSADCRYLKIASALESLEAVEAALHP